MLCVSIALQPSCRCRQSHLQAAERQQELGRQAQAGSVAAHRRASRQAELQGALAALRRISGEVEEVHGDIEGMQQQLGELA
jgi:hypothetical protein